MNLSDWLTPDWIRRQIKKCDELGIEEPGVIGPPDPVFLRSVPMGVVEGLGGYGERVTEPREIKPALQRAFDSGVAACVNVIVDPSLMQRASYLG